VLLKEVAKFKGWCTHGDAKGLGLVTASYNAAIVTGEYNNWLPFELGPKDTLATYEEVIAVNESIDSFHGRN
jgi:hypothetical protein